MSKTDNIFCMLDYPLSNDKYKLNEALIPVVAPQELPVKILN